MRRRGNFVNFVNMSVPKKCAYDLYECDTFSIGWDGFLTRVTEL